MRQNARVAGQVGPLSWRVDALRRHALHRTPTPILQYPQPRAQVWPQLHILVPADSAVRAYCPHRRCLRPRSAPVVDVFCLCRVACCAARRALVRTRDATAYIVSTDIHAIQRCATARCPCSGSVDAAAACQDRGEALHKRVCQDRGARTNLFRLGSLPGFAATGFRACDLRRAHAWDFRSHRDFE